MHDYVDEYIWLNVNVKNELNVRMNDNRVPSD